MKSYPQAVRGGKVFGPLDLCIESWCRVWVDRHDRQPGECVNKAVTCSTLDPSRRTREDLAEQRRQWRDWRFGNIRFSVNWYGDSDDRRYRIITGVDDTVTAVVARCRIFIIFRTGRLS